MYNPEITLFAADGTIQTNPETGLWQGVVSDLRIAYYKISKLPYFPSGKCANASIDIFLEYGFSGQAGWFAVDYPEDPAKITERFITHFWNMHHDFIYDLTLTQFNAYLKNPLPSGIIIAEMGSSLWNRYIFPNNPIVDQLGLERT